MLAGETAVGQYPSAPSRPSTPSCGQPSGARGPGARRARATPGTSPDIRTAVTTKEDHGRALCEAAVALADRANATAIVAVTGAGRTARMLAALRPGARSSPPPARQDRGASGARVGRHAGLDRRLPPDAVRAILTRAASSPGAVVYVSIHAVLRTRGRIRAVERL